MISHYSCVNYLYNEEKQNNRLSLRKYLLVVHHLRVSVYQENLLYNFKLKPIFSLFRSLQQRRKWHLTKMTSLKIWQRGVSYCAAYLSTSLVTVNINK